MVDPITVLLSVPSAPFKINSTVRLAATVMQGTSPAAGASVLFKVLKPNGSTASKIVTADSTGKAAWGYRVGPKDPVALRTIHYKQKTLGPLVFFLPASRIVLSVDYFRRDVAQAD